MIVQLGSQYAAAFSPDSRWLATGANVLTLWDLHELRRVRSWPVPESIAQLAFSPDGRFLAARAEHSTVTVFDLTTQKQIGQHDGTLRVPRPNGFAFIDSDHLVECSYDGSISRFTRGGEFIDKFTVKHGSFHAMRRVGTELFACLSRDSSWWGRSPASALLRLSPTLQLIAQAPIERMSELRSLCVGADANRAWVAGRDKKRTLQLVSVSPESGEELGRESCGGDKVALTPTGLPIVFGYKCFELHAGDGTVSHELSVSDVMSSPDGNWLVIAGYDGTWLLDREESERRLASPTTTAEWASIPLLPTELSAEELEQMALPDDLRAFLAEGRQWEYDHSACDAGHVVLHGLGQLAYSTCGVTSYDTDVRDEDPAGDEDGWYLVPMVSLVAKCEDYGPDYLLTWLPEERLFGTYDIEHRHLRVFPRATWSDICADPARYINSQWEAADDFAEDARPWLIPGRPRTM